MEVIRFPPPCNTDPIYRSWLNSCLRPNTTLQWAMADPHAVNSSRLESLDTEEEPLLTSFAVGSGMQHQLHPKVFWASHQLTPHSQQMTTAPFYYHRHSVKRERRWRRLLWKNWIEKCPFWFWFTFWIVSWRILDMLLVGIFTEPYIQDMDRNNAAYDLLNKFLVDSGL